MGYVINLKGLDQHHSNTLCFKNYYFSSVMMGTQEKYIDLSFVLILLESEWANVSFSSTALNFLSRKKLLHVWSPGVLIHVPICFILCEVKTSCIILSHLHCLSMYLFFDLSHWYWSMTYHYMFKYEDVSMNWGRFQLLVEEFAYLSEPSIYTVFMHLIHFYTWRFLTNILLGF